MTQTFASADTNFTITTLRCDRFGAELQMVGDLDEGAAAVLRALINGHVRDGRRYLRLDVHAVTTADRPSLRLLAELHRHLLDRRGTLILTGVTEALETVLAAAEAELFLVAATAADRLD